VLECPEENELPEVEEANRLPAREVAQTPDEEAMGQSSPIILPQGVDIPKHADDGCGYSGLFVAKKIAEDEVCSPLTISQLGRRLILLPPQKVPQIPKPQGRTPGTLNSVRIINAQNVQSHGTRYRLTRGNPTPKTDAQDGAPVYGKHPISQVLRWKVPVW
jgi:hypothetical protein